MDAVPVIYLRIMTDQKLSTRVLDECPIANALIERRISNDKSVSQKWMIGAVAERRGFGKIQAPGC
jgi:hypothetical protein